MRLATALAACLWTLPAAAGNPAVGLTAHDGELAIAIGDVEVARYVYRDADVPRPYFAHLKTPGGIPVTRRHPPVAGEDAVDHAGLHPGLWLSFGDLSGHDYWRLKAQTEHVRFVQEPVVTDDRGTFMVEQQYLTTDGRGVVCRETCRYTVVSLAGGYRIDSDSEFRPAGDDPVVFGDQEEMGWGVRVATALAVDRQQGGRILDSAGRRNGEAVWGHTAPWCDYSGPLDGRWVGVTLLAGGNFRPAWCHARDYGVLVMNPFGRRAFTNQEPSRIVVTRQAPLRLRFAVVVHESPAEGDYDPALRFREYTAESAQ